MNGLVVNATDGPVGTVEELLRNKRGEPTHIVVHERQAWGKEEIVVPVEEIEHVETDHIQLRMNTRGLSLLPALLATQTKTA